MEQEKYMEMAYEEALKALAIKEVPIGCVIIKEGQVVGRGHNRRNTEHNALYHAEIQAIDMACKFVGDWRLEDCFMYVTVEPCPMCAGAILQCRLESLAFGARNTKAGCCGSVMDLMRHPGFNHKVNVIPGLLEAKCGALMSDFFRSLRDENK